MHLLTLYISTVFMFTPIATVIEDKGEHYFKRSSYLMKGNFIKLIGLAFIMKGMFSLPSYYLRLIKYKDVVMPNDIRLVQILVKKWASNILDAIFYKRISNSLSYS